MLSFFFNSIPNLLLYSQNYYSYVGLKNSTQKLHFEKTPFEAQHFANGDKKHEDQILLLFLKGA